MSVSPELLAQIKGAKAKFQRSSRAFKFKEGKTVIRLLGKPNTKWWAELGVHWIKLNPGDKPVAVVGCTEIVKDQPCAVCNAIEKAAASATDDETLKLIKEWRAKKNVLVNALIRSGPEKSDNPQVVELPGSVAEFMFGAVEMYAEHGVDIIDLETGVDFIVERKGSGIKDTEYTTMASPKSFPVPAGTLDKLTDLNAWIEKEFFRGEEPKAIRAIGNMMGFDMTMPALTGPKPSAGALTGPGGVVSDAEIEAVIASTPSPSIAPAPVATAAPATAPAAAAATAAPKFGSDIPVNEIDAMLAELEAPKK